ncbi:Hypothetical predicted protein [Marmota monax]|uniref:Uncharacterized protein n=1 Tax=Marmota monax TaxID=9995 RepID=A0A5E4BX89_MARMO|nr:hypothetical protein GHT09_014956 [Marmota monax]VTJ73846.1 Hypothetical predicted protein [Marmota monax]
MASSRPCSLLAGFLICSSPVSPLAAHEARSVPKPRCQEESVDEVRFAVPAFRKGDASTSLQCGFHPTRTSSAFMGCPPGVIDRTEMTLHDALGLRGRASPFSELLFVCAHEPGLGSVAPPSSAGPPQATSSRPGSHGVTQHRRGPDLGTQQGLGKKTLQRTAASSATVSGRVPGGSPLPEAEMSATNLVSLLPQVFKDGVDAALSGPVTLWQLEGSGQATPGCVQRQAVTTSAPEPVEL